VSRLPVAFPLPAFATRSSDARRGVRLSSRSAYRARPPARTSTGLPRSARTSFDRGGCPLYPEDGGAHPGLRDVLSRRLPLPSGQSFDPAPASHRQGSASRGINEGSSNSPVRSSPRLRPPGWNEPPLGLPPDASAPRRPGADDARQGRGQAVEHGPGTTRSTSHPLTLQSVVPSLRATSRRTVHSGRLALGLRDARDLRERGSLASAMADHADSGRRG
jgi:hypothetical protein